jgi:Kunitz/Bovine pancreatic trypsin inhibitor domain
MTRMHLTWLSAALLACGSAADLGTPYTPDASSGGSAGASGGDASRAMCLYEGGSYPVGATFPAGDGCNSCTCFAPGDDAAKSPTGDVRCTRCVCVATDAGPMGCGSGGTPDAAPDGATTSVCSLPFDSGPCDAAIRVFAYVGGACVEQIYGGCLGNGNRFGSIEECMVTCDGRPNPRGCSDGRLAKTICLACGPAGGCARQAEVCAEACGDGAACVSRQFQCWDGVCQAGGCI